METGSKRPRIRLGMVGGGQDAFIGGVHRMAARLDDEFELVAGALSSSPERALGSGQALGLPSDRIYTDYETMARSENARPDGIDAVAIVTPNHMHFKVAETFLNLGFHVICDKPMTLSLTEAQRLHDMVSRSSRVFVLTHNYSGYPMVRQAREMVQSGAIGDVRVVQAEYPQGWLSSRQDSKQAEWRSDPARAGAGGSIGDIGTHAYHLAQFVTGLTAEELTADLATFVPGRQLDDNAHILLRYKGGARGMIWSSQVAIGKENALRLRVFGSRGGLEWSQEEPNILWVHDLGASTRKITRGSPEAGEAASRVTRIPAGHPEGYLEGFATIYREAAELIRAADGDSVSDPAAMAPDSADGLAGLQFIDACVRSNLQGSSWVRI
ncbi:MAG: Gfo/Idh/MocA family oxidoreductase [Alphaproteobacteria bacterium]|nr:Gfo/Idh/MocA family oxidoreductase [Alphaproteobacteria bacterium]